VQQGILIAGASGLIGKSLVQMFLKQGFPVHTLGRSAVQALPGTKHFTWDINNGRIREGAFDSIAHIINLAGENIAGGRWTQQRKQQILDSREKSTELLLSAAKSQSANIVTYVSASAVGFYGAVTNETINTESSGPANDFLGTTCARWEAAADQFESLGSRVVKIRIGVVLTSKGGALEKMATPARYGLGAVLGSGRQYLPWIHIEDLCRIFAMAIANERIKGPYNAVAPQYTTMREFTIALGAALHKPVWLPPVPGWLLKLAMGEMSLMVLEGSRVSPDKIISAGYNFRFSDVGTALQDLLGQPV